MVNRIITCVVMTTILLIASPKILSVIGLRGSRALERLMGMILVILATQMLLNGIAEFVKRLLFSFFKEQRVFVRS